MKTYKTESIIKDVRTVTGVICDVCGKSHHIGNNNINDELEFYEFINIHHDCGYGSIFGDGNQINIDICQYCVKKLLGKHLHVSDR